jgi:hypothetical protein
MNPDPPIEQGAAALGASTHSREAEALFAVSIGLLPGSLGVLAVPGFLLGLPALISGLFLASRSRLWSRQQKVLFAAIPVLFGTGLIIAGYAVTHFSMEDEDATYWPPWQVAAVWIGFLSLFLAPAVLAAHLNTAARRAASRQPHPQRARGTPLE